MCRFQATVWVSPKYYLITIRIGICKSNIMTTKTVSSFLFLSFLSFHALIIQMNVLDIDWGWSKIANTAKKEEQMLNESYECELLSWVVKSVYQCTMRKRIRMQNTWMFYKWSSLLTESTFMLFGAQQAGSPPPSTDERCTDFSLHRHTAIQ